MVGLVPVAGEHREFSGRRIERDRNGRPTLDGDAAEPTGGTVEG